jgi:hypothetical protein
MYQCYGFKLRQRNSEGNFKWPFGRNTSGKVGPMTLTDEKKQRSFDIFSHIETNKHATSCQKLSREWNVIQYYPENKRQNLMLEAFIPMTQKTSYMKLQIFKMLFTFVDISVLFISNYFHKAKYSSKLMWNY